LSYHKQHGYLWPYAWVLGLLAEAVLLEGDHARALSLHQQGLNQFHECGDIYAVLDGLIAVATQTACFGQLETAARLLGCVGTYRVSVGHRTTWATVDETDAINAVQRALSSDTFAAEFENGKALSLDDAVSLAMSVEPTSNRRQADPPSVVVDKCGLSPREREVLRLLAEGKSNLEIGETLFISPRTAGTHVTNILGKLGVNSRAAAVAFALNNRLI
jgi:DNA-binding CsgD family transcriptional regulator